MRLTDYLDTARDRAGFPSDRRLAAALGVAQNTIVQYRAGLGMPSPEKMVRLAELAGVSAERALLDRLAWQADGAVSRNVVSQMLARFMEDTARNPLKSPRSLGAAATEPRVNSGRLRYIMERMALWIIRGKQQLDHALIGGATERTWLAPCL